MDFQAMACVVPDLFSFITDSVLEFCHSVYSVQTCGRCLASWLYSVMLPVRPSALAAPSSAQRAPVSTACARRGMYSPVPSLTSSNLSSGCSWGKSSTWKVAKSKSDQTEDYCSPPAAAVCRTPGRSSSPQVLLQRGAASLPSRG